MKSLFSFFSAAALGCCLLFSACAENSRDRLEDRADSLSDRVETGIDNLGDKVDHMVDGDADQNFLEDAIEANVKELYALQAGIEKGGAQVARLAKNMLADHQDLGADVQNYIREHNIVLDDVDTGDLANPLANQSGNEFDREWADKMVADHEDVVDLFEDARDDVKDPALRNMIVEAIPVLQQHLQHSRDLQANLRPQR